jgi:cytochrome c551/c552
VQRELKAEVGVWKAEIMKVEMMTMVDERADLTKWRLVSVMSKPNRKPVDVFNVI